MKDEISVSDLKVKLDQDPKAVLIDVREENEFAEVNLSAKLIPLSEFESRWEEVPREGEVFIHCRSGKRSRDAIEFLKKQGYDNCLNVTGGILAWLEEVDPSGR